MSNAQAAVVRAYVEALNAFDMGRLRDLFAPDACIYGVLGHGGLDVAEPIWRELHDGLNMRLEVLALIAEEGQGVRQVAVRYRETGRFIGPFRALAGHAPTGLAYEVPAMEWFELDGGRITARWGARDFAAITRQVLGH